MENAKHVTFDLTLDNQVKGEQVLENPVCHFSYSWDEKKNMGMATLHSINGSFTNVTLHPLGIKGELDFMSDIPPTHFTVNASNDDSIALINITIYRVILDITDKSKEAAIMFGMDGSSIQATKGFMEESASKQLPEVVNEGQEAPEGV